jgi:large subunit ribosomal protein L35
MPKMKSNRGAMKRFKVTAKGKVKRYKEGKSHILTKKTRKRKRNLRKAALIDKTIEKKVKKMLLAV